MKPQILLLTIFVTILFSLTNQVIVNAESVVLTVDPSDTYGESFGAVVPVSESSTFCVVASINSVPAPNVEAKPVTSEWHFNGITGMNNTTIGADEANTWTTSNSQSIAVPHEHLLQKTFCCLSRGIIMKVSIVSLKLHGMNYNMRNDFI
ncbi:MAG: hypothetical protein LBC74_10150 [Planctomycetaceae bacterium]|jgi:hypothetical protein|nr:hypothetical protein [Planctomycetaceae bacterium]